MPQLPPPLLPQGEFPSAGTPGPSMPAKTSGLAIASLVLGILSCPVSCLTAIPGLICGIVGLVKIRSSETASTGPRLTGGGLALFADGHVEGVGDDIDPEVFKALLTRSGAESLPADW